MAVLVFLPVWTLYDVASTRSDNTDSVGDAIPGSLIDAFEDVYAANAHWCATNARGPPRFNTSGTAFFGGKGDPQVDGAGTREGQGAQVSLCGRLNLLDHCAIPRLRENSSKRRRPCKASRMIRMLHHSPTRSRLRAIGHSSLMRDLRCMAFPVGLCKCV